MKFDEDREILPALGKACADCPWRVSNRGRRNEHGFYTAKNLRRLWAGMRNGERMTCHPTDPRMAEYEGYEKTEDAPVVRECAGSLLLKAREVTLLNSIAAKIPEGKKVDVMKLYKAVSPMGLTRRGIIKIIEDTAFAGRSALAMRSDFPEDLDVAYVKIDEAKARAAGTSR